MKRHIVKIAIPMAIILAGLMILAGCGQTETQTDATDESATTAAAETATETETNAETEAAEEDGQNPVMNYIGAYGSGRALITIEADGSTGAKATVRWGSSAWEESQWTMSGPFDVRDRTIKYQDCVKKDIKYDDDGSVKSEKEVYTDGRGYLAFGKDETLTWQDDQEHVADGTIFLFDPEMTE